MINIGSGTVDLPESNRDLLFVAPCMYRPQPGSAAGAMMGTHDGTLPAAAPTVPRYTVPVHVICLASTGRMSQPMLCLLASKRNCTTCRASYKNPLQDAHYKNQEIFAVFSCSSAFLVLQTRNHLEGATRYKIQEKGTPPSFSMLLVSFADFERHMRCFEGKFYFWMTIFSDFGGLYDVSQMQEIQENLGLKTCATNKKFSGKSRYIVLQTNFIFDLVASPDYM